MLFEAPHRLPEMLADAAAILGERPAVVARELTKLFETVRRGTLPELASDLRRGGQAEGRDRRPDRRKAAAEADGGGRGRPRRGLAAALGAHSIKDAAAIVAAELGLPKREVYARALALAAAKDA